MKNALCKSSALAVVPASAPVDPAPVGEWATSNIMFEPISRFDGTFWVFERDFNTDQIINWHGPFESLEEALYETLGIVYHHVWERWVDMKGSV